MYKHLILKVLTLLAITLYPFGHVFAQQSEPADVTITEEFGILTNDDTGEGFQIPVMVTIQDLGNGRFVTEYSAEIPQSILDTQEKSANDPTYSARVTIHQTYTTRIVDQITYVSVSQYKGKWTRLDPAVTCTRVEVTAACNGTFLDGGYCSQWKETRLQNNPAPDVWYSMTPSWSGRFIRTSNFEHNSGYTKVTLQRGGTTWTFQVTVCHGGDLCG